MKNRPIGALLVVCLLYAHVSFSQPICGFDAMHGKTMNADASYRRIITENETQLQQIILTQKNRKARINATNVPLYTIPVVVHVMHTGDAVGTIYNPDDARITGAINFLNQVYNGTMAGGEGVGDIQIQFVLANSDPDCNATNGIDRVDASSIPNYAARGVNADSTNGATELNVKNFSRWDPYNYYNIWVVNKIDSKDGTIGQFIAGYATLPGGSPEYDGTVMLATQMIAGAKTLPHEIGHALFLFHPFQGSMNATHCPAETNCSNQGDYVCDTDPITFNRSTLGVVDFSCRTGTNTCAPGTPLYSINTEHNFMNYTNCFTLFTAGQKARMLAAMSLLVRRELATSWASVSTYPVTYAVPANPCTPVTSPTGTSDNFAGILRVSLSNKVFYSGGTSDDNGTVDRTGYCHNLIALQAGGSYPLSTTLISANHEQINAWIDYNNNGTFEAGERILRDDSIPPTGTTTVVNTAFTVPSGAITGQVLRMRVMDELSSEYSFVDEITDGCYNPIYGQAEDFAVVIAASALPVTWAYFKGVKEGNTVKLLWKTVSEVNASHFEVERSYNGTDYTSIGTVEANGLSSIYNFDDNTYTGALMYYRLKQVDLNGQFTYTNIVTVKNETVAENGVNILNNPFRENLEISINTAIPSKVMVQLLDVTGKLLYTQSSQVSGNSILTVLPGARKLPAGIYLVRIQLNGKTITRKVIKE